MLALSHRFHVRFHHSISEGQTLFELAQELAQMALHAAHFLHLLH